MSRVDEILPLSVGRPNWKSSGMLHEATSNPSAIARIQAALEQEGFWYCPRFSSVAGARAALDRLAAAFGDRANDSLVTRPAAHAPASRPFDQAATLGWHSDFSTHAQRPRYTFALVITCDPRGSPFGDWRVASVDNVVRVLSQTQAGRVALNSLSETAAPFTFDDETCWYPILQRQRGRAGLRFYGASIRAALEKERPRHRARLLKAVTALEQAADYCAITLAARTGALLAVNNWRALHSRLEQTVGVPEPRQAILRFVR